MSRRGRVWAALCLMLLGLGGFSSARATSVVVTVQRPQAEAGEVAAVEQPAEQIISTASVGTQEAPDEEAPQGEISLTGYFADRAYVRPAMVQTTDTVDSIPPYAIVTLAPVDDSWAVYTSPKGKTGYVKYGKLLPVPEYEREEPRYVYGEKRVEIRSLPAYDAQKIYAAEPYELMTVDGRCEGFLHVIAAEGAVEGYVMPGWVQRAEFSPKAISPTAFVVSTETATLEMPLQGSPTGEVLSPAMYYVATGTYGNYYALEQSGKTVYIDKGKVALWSQRGPEGRTFFTLPRGGEKTREDQAEMLFLGGKVGDSGAALLRTQGKAMLLPPGARVYLYAGYGDWVGAVYEEQAGYLRREEVTLLTGESLVAELAGLDLSGGTVTRNAFLDQALAMLERGNPFQARYNYLTGAQVESLFPLGIPYFWGGRSYTITKERWPEYTTREAWQSSPVFYQKGTVYLYGFDCVGFVKNVYSLAGLPIQGDILDLRDRTYCDAGQHVYCDDVYPLPADWTEAARNMQIGDIMEIHHPRNHVMIYLGTLRSFGYTAEQLPALADYLDYPLMLQSGGNPYSYLRFQSWIASSSDARTRGASPTDGGASVCILGVPRERAELVMEVHDETQYGFDVEGSCVTIMSFGNVRDYFVYRMPKGD